MGNRNWGRQNHGCGGGGGYLSRVLPPLLMPPGGPWPHDPLLSLVAFSPPPSHQHSRSSLLLERRRGGLTQRIECRQHIHVNRPVEMFGFQREAQHPGSLPLGDLKRHFQVLLGRELLIGFQLLFDLLDDVVPLSSLGGEAGQRVHEHHEVGVRAGLEGGAFAGRPCLARTGRLRPSESPSHPGLPPVGLRNESPSWGPVRAESPAGCLLFHTNRTMGFRRWQFSHPLRCL